MSLLLLLGRLSHVTSVTEWIACILSDELVVLLRLPYVHDRSFPRRWLHARKLAQMHEALLVRRAAWIEAAGMVEPSLATEEGTSGGGVNRTGTQQVTRGRRSGGFGAAR